MITMGGRMRGVAGGIVILGLTDDDVALLKDGESIAVADDVRETLGLDWEVLFVHGATAESIVRRLEDDGMVPPGAYRKIQEAMAASPDNGHVSFGEDE